MGDARPRHIRPSCFANGSSNPVAMTRAPPCYRPTSALQRAGGLGRMGSDGVHQGWRQRVVGFQPELSQPASDGPHAVRAHSRFDDGGYEGGKFRRRPARFLRQLDVDKIKSIEWMILVFDPAVHMDTASSASVTVNGLAGVNNLQLLTML